jgi:hypothetical protein
MNDSKYALLYNFNLMGFSIRGNWAVEWIAANPNSELAELTLGNGSDYGGTPYCAHSDVPFVRRASTAY